MKIKEGDKVTIVVVTPWTTTEELRVIEEIIDDNIYIDGLDIPFDLLSGKKTEIFFGTKVYIKEIFEKK